MASGQGAYERDLQLVPHRLRAPLEAFIWSGVLPVAWPALMALIEGDVTTATRLYGSTGRPFSGAVVFLDNHCPDVAWGHPSYVLRWERWGGLNGRKRFG